MKEILVKVGIWFICCTVLREELNKKKTRIPKGKHHVNLGNTLLLGKDDTQGQNLEPNIRTHS